MLPFQTQDAVAVLRKSENLNAALKNFLKREVRKGDPAARFVKDLKELAETPESTNFEGYIEKTRSKFEPQLIGIGSYAHQETVGQIVEQIAEKYADEFNATYNSNGQVITVINKTRFDEIVKVSFELIDSELAKRNFKDSAFLKNIVLYSIFEKPVLEHIFAK